MAEGSYSGAVYRREGTSDAAAAVSAGQEETALSQRHTATGLVVPASQAQKTWMLHFSWQRQYDIGDIFTCFGTELKAPQVISHISQLYDIRVTTIFQDAVFVYVTHDNKTGILTREQW